MTMVSASMTRRARSLGITERQVDSWSRLGFLPTNHPGSGIRRDWSKVTDRRLCACALVNSTMHGASIARKRQVIDHIDQRGVAVINTGFGAITLSLSPVPSPAIRIAA